MRIVILAAAAIVYCLLFAGPSLANDPCTVVAGTLVCAGDQSSGVSFTNPTTPISVTSETDIAPASFNDGVFIGTDLPNGIDAKISADIRASGWSGVEIRQLVEGPASGPVDVTIAGTIAAPGGAGVRVDSNVKGGGATSAAVTVDATGAYIAATYTDTMFPSPPTLRINFGGVVVSSRASAAIHDADPPVAMGGMVKVTTGDIHVIGGNYAALRVDGFVYAAGYMADASATGSSVEVASTGSLSTTAFWGIDAQSLTYVSAVDANAFGKGTCP